MSEGTAGRRTGAGTAASIVLLALSLGGCASTLADLPVVGMPAGAPARPTEPGGYLPIHDLPAPREAALLDPGEQAKLQAELAAARDRQAVVIPAAPAARPK